MTKKEEAKELRKRAEKQHEANKKNAKAPADTDNNRLVHELEVHQIELEMQNEELQRSRVEVEKGHDKYTELYDFAPTGYLTLDENGLILQANLTFATMLGIPRGKLINQPITRFIEPEDQDIYYHHSKKAFEKNEPQACEIRLLRVGHSPFWALLVGIISRDADGKTVCRVVASDISAKKQADIEISKARKKAETYLQIAGTMFIAIDDRGIVTMANDRAAEILGYPVDEIVGKNWFDNFIPKRLRKEIKAVSNKILNGDLEPVKEFENPVLTKSSEERLIHWENTYLYDDNGNIKGHLGSGLDVTERVKAKKELEEIFNMSMDMICIADINTSSFIKVNPAFTRILGYSEKELTGSKFDKYLHPDDKEKTDDVVKTQLQKGKTVLNFENRYKTKNGECKILSWTSHPIAEQGITYAVAHDVTEERKIGEEIARTKDFYESIIEGVQDGIWVTDKDDNIFYANNSMGIIAGIPSEDLIGNNVLKDFPDETSGELNKLYKKAKKELQPTWYEVKVKTPAGRETYQNGWLIPRIKDGKYDGIICTIRDVTDRKKADVALKESEQEKDWLLRSMINAFVIFDSVFDDNGKFISYRFVYINKAYEEITGMKNEEVMGKTVHEVWPETENTWIQKYGEVAVSGIAQTFEMYHDPTKKWYHCNVYRPWDSQDRFCVIFEDITMSKMMYDSLKKSEERFWNISKNINDIIWQIDENGIFTFVSPSVKKMLGYRPFEVEGTPVFNYFKPEDKERIIKNMASREKGNLLTYEYEMITKDGKFISVEVSSSANYDENGKLQGFSGVTRDIRERKKAQQAITEREAQLRAMFDASIDGICVEKDDIINYVNTSLLEMFGYQASSMLENKHLTELVIPEDHHKIIEISKRRRAGDKTVPERFEFRGVRFDGSTLDCEMAGSTFTSGKDTYYVGFIRDISEQKRKEREMKRSIMKYDIEDGHIYLNKNETYVESIEILNELARLGYNISCFSRTPKEHLQYDLPEGTINIWISEKGRGISVKPTEEAILHAIEFMPDNRVIFLTGLDYLSTKMSQKKIISLLQGLREAAYVHDHIILVQAEPKIFSEKQLKMLENECMEIKALVREAVPEPLEDILKFTFEQNIVGIKPTYSSISNNLKMSMPTVRKRVSECLNNGYIIEKKKGRTKNLEITEKGRSLFSN